MPSPVKSIAKDPLSVINAASPITPPIIPGRDPSEAVSPLSFATNVEPVGIEKLILILSEADTKSVISSKLAPAESVIAA
jgi:hypothetical protein